VLVEFALIDQDTLLERNAIRVSAEAQCAHLELFQVAHQLCGGAAKIVLSSFAPTIGLRTVDLDVPVHRSADWEFRVRAFNYRTAALLSVLAFYFVLFAGIGTYAFPYLGEGP
jgi:hypothetical protein